jgi:cell division protein FtsQ
MIAALARHRVLCRSAVIALAVAALVWAALAGGTAALREHPYFAVGQVVMHGCGPALTPDDVQAWLALTDETTVWDASPARVRARLEANPFIARAAVRRQFPGRLELVIHERRPQAIAVLDDLYYVDRAGVTFGPLRPRDNRDYPVITGLAAGMADGPRAWALRRALRLLRRCGREPCIGELSEVHLETARGVVVYPSAPRVPIVLGWGSWPVKLERAQRALDAWHGPVERLAAVDVRFRNQVVLSFRPAPPPPAAPLNGHGRARGLKA